MPDPPLLPILRVEALGLQRGAMPQPQGTSPLSCPFEALTPTLLSYSLYPSTPVCFTVHVCVWPLALPAALADVFPADLVPRDWAHIHPILLPLLLALPSPSELHLFWLPLFLAVPVLCQPMGVAPTYAKSPLAPLPFFPGGCGKPCCGDAMV